MPTSHAITTAANPALSVLHAKRQQQTAQEWAEEHVAIVLNGGNSTSPASGSGDPLEHVIVWSKGGREYSTKVESWGGQTELDELVQAMKDAIVADGGTIVSG